MPAQVRGDLGAQDRVVGIARGERVDEPGEEAAPEREPVAAGVAVPVHVGPRAAPRAPRRVDDDDDVEEALLHDGGLAGPAAHRQQRGRSLAPQAVLGLVDAHREGHVLDLAGRRPRSQE